MSIEEPLRDERNLRFGWGLSQTKVGEAERSERLLLPLAFAYLLLILVGKKCQGQCSPGHWASAVGRRRQTAGSFIGRCAQVHVCCRISALTRLLADAVRARWLRRTGDESAGRRVDFGVWVPVPCRHRGTEAAPRLSRCM
jgi:hypothetical protein